MPTYDYACARCGHKFEQYQSITATPLRKCPACGQRTLQRLLGAGAGIIFKGSGFYQTDYRSESYKKAAAAEKTAAPAAAGDKDSGSKAADQPAAGRDGKPASSGDGKAKSGTASQPTSTSGSARCKSRKPVAAKT